QALPAILHYHFIHFSPRGTEHYVDNLLELARQPSHELRHAVAVDGVGGSLVVVGAANASASSLGTPLRLLAPVQIQVLSRERGAGDGGRVGAGAVGDVGDGEVALRAVGTHLVVLQAVVLVVLHVRARLRRQLHRVGSLAGAGACGLPLPPLLRRLHCSRADCSGFS
uniref:Uncharacterized protein n=1 Tax=Triticum urartu TaxID=4572 RepID=A0A8R7UJ02_TRIUA